MSAINNIEKLSNTNGIIAVAVYSENNGVLVDYKFDGPNCKIEIAEHVYNMHRLYLDTVHQGTDESDLQDQDQSRRLASNEAGEEVSHNLSNDFNSSKNSKNYLRVVCEGFTIFSQQELADGESREIIIVFAQPKHPIIKSLRRSIKRMARRK